MLRINGNISHVSSPIISGLTDRRLLTGLVQQYVRDYLGVLDASDLDTSGRDPVAEIEKGA